MMIDSIRFLLERLLRESELSKVYTIGYKRRPGIPNIDLSPNKIRGNYICPNALSIVGLKCMEIPYNQMAGFQPKELSFRRKGVCYIVTILFTLNDKRRIKSIRDIKLGKRKTNEKI
jgi:hypothetical protein